MIKADMIGYILDIPHNTGAILKLKEENQWLELLNTILVQLEVKQGQSLQGVIYLCKMRTLSSIKACFLYLKEATTKENKVYLEQELHRLQSVLELLNLNQKRSRTQLFKKIYQAKADYFIEQAIRYAMDYPADCYPLSLINDQEWEVDMTLPTSLYRYGTIQDMEATMSSFGYIKQIIVCPSRKHQVYAIIDRIDQEEKTTMKQMQASLSELPAMQALCQKRALRLHPRLEEFECKEALVKKLQAPYDFENMSFVRGTDFSFMDS